MEDTSPFISFCIQYSCNILHLAMSLDLFYNKNQAIFQNYIDLAYDVYIVKQIYGKCFCTSSKYTFKSCKN